MRKTLLALALVLVSTTAHAGKPESWVSKSPETCVGDIRQHTDKISVVFKEGPGGSDPEAECYFKTESDIGRRILKECPYKTSCNVTGYFRHWAPGSDETGVDIEKVVSVSRAIAIPVEFRGEWCSEKPFLEEGYPYKRCSGGAFVIRSDGYRTVGLGEGRDWNCTFTSIEYNYTSTASASISCKTSRQSWKERKVFHLRDDGSLVFLSY